MGGGLGLAKNLFIFIVSFRYRYVKGISVYCMMLAYKIIIHSHYSHTAFHWL